MLLLPVLLATVVSVFTAASVLFWTREGASGVGHARAPSPSNDSR